MRQFRFPDIQEKPMMGMNIILSGKDKLLFIQQHLFQTLTGNTTSFISYQLYTAHMLRLFTCTETCPYIEKDY